MTFSPEQLAVYREYFSILQGIAHRLIREGKAHVENGKLIIHEKEQKIRRRKKGVQ